MKPTVFIDCEINPESGEFFNQKIQQIHIIGEYANLMVRDYSAALQSVQDYFQMDFKKFIARYFKFMYETPIKAVKLAF